MKKLSIIPLSDISENQEIIINNNQEISDDGVKTKRFSCFIDALNFADKNNIKEFKII